MDDPDGIQVTADVEQDAEGGDKDAHPPRGQVYLQRNANSNGLTEAENGEGNANPGVVSGTLKRMIGRLFKKYSLNSTWTRIGTYTMEM